MFGVSFAILQKLKKEIGQDQALADALWASGNHDARMLATMTADPAKMAAKELEAWAADLDNYVVADAFSRLAAQSSAGRALMQRWIRSRDEWRSSAGWNVLTQLLKNDRLATKELQQKLVEIQTRIHQAPNRTRYAMNMALISIGCVDGLHEKAVLAARRIGKVDVDHGETGCETPDAESCIAKTLVRRESYGVRLDAPDN